MSTFAPMRKCPFRVMITPISNAPLIITPRCLHCFECPCCGSVLAPAPTSLEPSSSPQAARPQCCLQCLYCQWTSEEIGIVGPEPSRLPEAAIAREKKDDRDRTVVSDLLKSTKLRESNTLRIASGRFAGGRITWEDSSASPDVAPSDDSWKVAGTLLPIPY